MKKEDGREEVLQKISISLAKIGWSKNEFARSYYWEKEPYGTDEEEKKFVEKLKKQLLRTSTSIEKLENFLTFLLNQREDNSRENDIRNKISSQKFSPKFLKEMKAISKEIAEKIETTEYL